MSWKVSTGKNGVSKNFMGDETSDTHHGGTALVQFNLSLSKLGTFVELVPAKVKSTVTVVTDEFSFSESITVDHFCYSEKGKHLHQNSLAVTGGVKSGECSQTIRNALSTRETDAIGCDQVTNNGQHTDTSVFELNGTKTIESFLVSIGDKTKGIEEAKRSDGTNIVFEGRQSAGRSLLGGRSESSSRRKECGENSSLHGFNRFDESCEVGAFCYVMVSWAMQS
mmetsp:Transcript_18419/g.23698  ORF Transcript_18419/g.23698 Transcript_18419/m.23698 type:complete len:224 (-) Transcript_18419:41-712(-)